MTAFTWEVYSPEVVLLDHENYIDKGSITPRKQEKSPSQTADMLAEEVLIPNHPEWDGLNLNLLIRWGKKSSALYAVENWRIR